MAASSLNEHLEWLSLLDVSGPFLTLPVLLERLPDGLDPLETTAVGRLRAALAARDADRRSPAACREFVRFVLSELLEYDTDVLVEAEGQPDVPCLRLPEMGVELRPDLLLLPPVAGAPDDVLDLDAPTPSAPKEARRPVMLIGIAPGRPLEAPQPEQACSWSPARRMTELCRASGVPLGLVSDGEQFMLVYVRQNRTSSLVSWYARFWLEERITLRSFVTLLHMRRFFSLAEEFTLPRLMEQSANAQQDVTEKLGLQVRSAITEFLRAVDRLDRQMDTPMLQGLSPRLLYEAALTVMMRLVFLLSAEERGLLRLGDPAYDEAYAVSTLCESLREQADRHGEEVLSYRHDAWVRLLSLFRAVFGGIRHEALRLPAYGGSLFDPDVYPFLEGRPHGSCWRDAPARPLPVDNRVILHMLESLQFLRDRRTTGRDEAVRLSFRALGVEQIGHVYEGLLDRTAARADDVLLGLAAGQQGEPFLSLTEAETLMRQGEDALLRRLADLTHSQQGTLQKRLRGDAPRGRGRGGRQASLLAADETQAAAERQRARLYLACDGDAALTARILPFVGLLRRDSFDMPVVIPAGGLYVTAGSQRRDTGTHYTPRPLTELIVSATLEPHVYDGPAEGLPRAQWRLRAPDALLSLKVCDMSMGSGAFLVQACRYLAERLLEAWNHTPPASPLPEDAEERATLARRMVADRCLYGVDNNPLAVEMAKLSLWLTTLQKERPFTFLDHALRCGDALLGIVNAQQLEEFSLTPEKGNLVFGSTDMREAVRAAREARDALERLPSDTPLNVERKAACLAEAETHMALLRLRADALILATLRARGKLEEDARYQLVDKLLHPTFCHDADALAHWLEEKRQALLQGSGTATTEKDATANPGLTHPLHWALEFPEVFSRENPGFDALVGNPPFLGSQRMREALGNAYREYLVEVLAGGRRGKSDLVAYFFRRAAQLTRAGGDFGLIATNTLAQGDTREAGLLPLEQAGYRIRAAWPDTPWEGNATVCTSQIIIRTPDAQPYNGPILLNGTPVNAVSSFLKAGEEDWEARPLRENAGIAFQGSIVLGDGFLTDEEQARQWIAEDARNAAVLFPYLNGEDLTSSPEQGPSRWIINFYDWAKNIAESYQNIFRYLADNRDTSNKTAATHKKFWQFWRPRAECYHALGRGDAFAKHPKGWKAFPPLQRVLVIARVSKHGTFSFVPNRYIMSEATCVFASDDAALFGLLQSSLHQAWARKMSSTMRSDPRYTPSSAFDTFPRPAADRLDGLRDCAERLHALRAAVMRRENIGLTALYNALHDAGSVLSDVEALRGLHEELDRQAAAAYGWDDLDMSHDFRQVEYLPENDRTRHTIAEPVRLEIVRRLSALNRERYEAERNAAAKKPPRKTGTLRKKGGMEQGALL
ncbi:MAG TPA: hypothetical protein IAB01_05185 [Candidatus Avidesulfovibrio excrementigallinarum]|nr:hypothetical protein [Candidatus Avidesulfovibrio excrementigallinarum]